jgi:lipoate-protein ligase A
LSRLGIESNLCEPAEPDKFHGCLCFQHLTPGDLLVAESKVVGSAQRKRRGALLQHGGILLAQSQHTPELPGLLELTGKKLCVDEVVQAVRVAFANATGTVLMEQPLSADEQKLIVELKAEKYGTSIWNFKR